MLSRDTTKQKGRQRRPFFNAVVSAGSHRFGPETLSEAQRAQNRDDFINQFHVMTLMSCIKT